MGTPHTLQTTAADWILPTGQRAVPCEYLIEDDGATHGDSLGNMAKMLNNLYAYALPPAPVWDAHVSAFSTTTTGTPGDLFGEYRIPTVGIFDGTDQFKLKVTCECNVSGGATGQIRLETTPTNTTFNFTNSAYQEQSSSAIACDDDASLFETVKLYARIDSGSGTVGVRQWRVEWVAPTASTLLDGPYSSSILPIAPGHIGDLESSINVERVRRMIENALEIHKRRSPGMIISRWFDQTVVQTVIGSLTATVGARAIAKQPKDVNSISCSVYARNNTGTGNVTISVGNTTFTFGPYSSTSPVWQTQTGLPIPENAGDTEEPIQREFRAIVDSNVGLDGVCAWWEKAIL